MHLWQNISHSQRGRDRSPDRILTLFAFLSNNLLKRAFLVYTLLFQNLPGQQYAFSGREGVDAGRHAVRRQ